MGTFIKITAFLLFLQEYHATVKIIYHKTVIKKIIPGISSESGGQKEYCFPGYVI